mgnify:CR=1 FL=1
MNRQLGKAVLILVASKQFPFVPTSVKALPGHDREDNGNDSSDTTAEDTAQYRPDQTV